MSWKTNTIVVRPARLGDPDEFLGQLGYENRRKSKEVSFGNGAGDGSVWIGGVDDRIIMDTFVADHFFDRFMDGPPDQEFTFFKNALFRHFPEADIAAFFLDDRIDAWGFAVFRGGALLRRFYGHDGTMLGDEGSPLPEEIAYFANCDRVEVDEEILYRRHSDPPDEEPLGLAHHGGEILCEVWRSFTGYKFDAPALLQIPGSVFWLNDDEAKFRAKDGRQWWKFWG